MPLARIESKHLYQNSGFYSGDKSYFPLIWDNNKNITFTSPNGFYQCTPFVKAWTLPVPEQGTQENQRIGNKISPQSYHCDIVIMPLNLNDYLPNMFNKLFLGGGGIQSETNYLLTKSKYNMRLMVIDFYSDERFKIPANLIKNIENSIDDNEYNDTMLNLGVWYRNTFVPTGRNDTLNVSCSQKMLRESTEYTGKFKIMYDKLIKFSPKNHFSKRISLDLDLSKYKDFNIANGRYTKHNILICLFNCMAPVIDMDPVLYKILNVAYTEDKTEDKTNFINSYSLGVGFTGKLRYLDF